MASHACQKSGACPRPARPAATSAGGCRGHWCVPIRRIEVQRVWRMPGGRLTVHARCQPAGGGSPHQQLAARWHISVVGPLPSSREYQCMAAWRGQSGQPASPAATAAVAPRALPPSPPLPPPPPQQQPQRHCTWHELLLQEQLHKQQQHSIAALPALVGLAPLAPHLRRQHSHVLHVTTAAVAAAPTLRIVGQYNQNDNKVKVVCNKASGRLLKRMDQACTPENKNIQVGWPKMGGHACTLQTTHIMHGVRKIGGHTRGTLLRHPRWMKPSSCVAR
jgi:hypothetical protein